MFFFFSVFYYSFLYMLKVVDKTQMLPVSANRINHLLQNGEKYLHNFFQPQNSWVKIGQSIDLKSWLVVWSRVDPSGQTWHSLDNQIITESRFAHLFPFMLATDIKGNKSCVCVCVWFQRYITHISDHLFVRDLKTGMLVELIDGCFLFGKTANRSCGGVIKKWLHHLFVPEPDREQDWSSCGGFSEST